MGKLVTILLIILLTTGLAILGYFLQQGREHLLSDPYKAVPPGACFVIETSDLPNFLISLSASKGLFAEASQISQLTRFNKSIK